MVSLAASDVVFGRVTLTNHVKSGNVVVVLGDLQIPGKPPNSQPEEYRL